MNDKNFIEELKQKREEYGVTQTRLAVACGISRTYCTKLAQKNMNPKNLQYIMGHSNNMLTLNLYAHSSEVGANREIRSMIAWIYNEMYNE